ncbi:S-adenosyl-L-methionine-dependent methyltransferase [Conidiobolus coronatus NRRL 28638]|uniref:S-adenosyl-L-methionine-dependent methyltransferase n=1 Tax=Conidiobolus coronatus (strain ATCC 28846 / CBS 209.66 / NRRL 28638) TaxID=796925 RepID=A0A137NZ85_CONC2|nr:S-adenosyl-L-methionine-dependent methyltransferase [Conidiobolus coronatus NRRL 28638]|eukprot:KXN67944.1 S-adenosyl-L-methionine-dependent methyltransferase [Conidiobolus coronatus NRRL 28638]
MTVIIDDKGSMPMNDYNNSSKAQLKVIENSLESLKILNENIEMRGDSLAIGDLGCSHGKNSMLAINQLLGLIENNKNIGTKLKSLQVYHEDLKDNDFDQVQACLDDKLISYLHNSYITKNNIATDVRFLPKSFYEPLFEPSSIDIILCYTSVHWLPNYKTLTRGLWFHEWLETPENVEWFRKLSKDSLISWLNLRYEELETGGLISLNVLESHGNVEKLSLVWEDYIVTKGFSPSDLKKVIVPIMLRPHEEVNSCLSQFSKKFKVLRNHYSKGSYKFGRETLNALFSGCVIHGLGNYPEFFPTAESKNEFFQGFLDYFCDVNQYDSMTELGFVFLVLQKI